MCGIFGIIGNQKSNLSYKDLRSIVDHLFILSEARGKESSGIAIQNWNTNRISVFKKSIAATQLIKSGTYRKFFTESVESCFYDADGKKAQTLNSPLAMIAHARLVTNGTHDDNDNNQPVIKSGGVIVHNGIIVNVDELWNQNPQYKRSYEVDTEILAEMLMSNVDNANSTDSFIQEIFKKIEGSASFALLADSAKKLLIASNTGSLYILTNEKKHFFMFASERYILETLVKKMDLEVHFGSCRIQWIEPNAGKIIDIESLNVLDISPNKTNGFKTDFFEKKAIYKIQNASESMPTKPTLGSFKNGRFERLLEYNIESVKKLKRCNRCLLPETFPFLLFDSSGVCSYCNSYVKQKYLGMVPLREEADKIRDISGRPDCLVMFSGGRDSSYGLHFIKEELKLNPIAYTYDWGMVTDLARRNQARICGKLGVEHILVSADINYKRKNIQKNVAAWLKKPSLGTIPLFMAGDKQFFYYANYLSKINNLKIILLCENMLETTSFKSGFAGIRPNFGKDHNYYISFPQKMKMLFYYAKEFALNPAYINSSLRDSIGAFISYYFIPHNYFNIYNYFPWKEEEVESILLNHYNWETSADTVSTWRIGDGTAAFYNYIYFTVAGFSEFDTFRSNQIREGLISREEALKKIYEENKPRYESLQWYLNTIDVDFGSAIRKINLIPKLY
ncbi:hypothetical protein LFX25_07140 [Leptospira sp. FAT2]|uniref:hypothetical protein n=1 Tax=Leptospira sanjuanensis TaxID=2879643 RepID=UPI001EE934CD|nr:hypothetical protein [Leptospira sanjuanensis]MCG6167596.1 hypothetical protein [Leptospira sanjuanensis]MCG6193015.1 hypothetical protein [Leptospira sanjuanensis]